jgi:hypothetical protein
MMRNVSSELASSDVYLWSPTPGPVDSPYHKILESGKARRVTHDLGDPGAATELWETP